MTALDKLVTLELCRHLLMCPMLGDIDEPLIEPLFNHQTYT